MELAWLLYLQWSYAVWQFIRGDAIVRLLFKLPIWLLFYKSKKKRVILLNEVYEDIWQSQDVVAFSPGEIKNGVEIVSREGYWVKAKFNEEFFIAHQNQVAKIWYTDFNDDFVINKVDLTDHLCIATKLSRRDALLKIAGAFKLMEIRTTCVYGPEFAIPMNSNLAGFFSTLPLLAQAKGYTQSSYWISIALLTIDILRSPLYKAYDGAFEYVSLMIKVHVFKQRAWLYRLFSVCSERWAYGDKTKKCVYNGKGCGFLVHTIAVFKNKEDYELTFGYGDYESWCPAPEDQHFVINKSRIYALPILPKMGSYCKVICKIDALVTSRASTLYTQPLF